MNCPLCNSDGIDKYYSQTENIPWALYGFEKSAFPAHLNFYICNNCDLVFKDLNIRPTQQAEKKHYLKHNNDLNDTNYCNYMLKMIKPVAGKVKSGNKFLDFGCGYSPVLSSLLFKDGIEVDNYDPFFYPEFSTNNITYDGIFVSEVAEHFFNPKIEFNTIFSKLKPNGQLVLRTKIVPQSGFNDWWYMRDPTHVVFYSIKTFQFIANIYQCDYQEFGEDIYVFSFLSSS